MEQTIDIQTPTGKIYKDRAIWVGTFLGGPLAAGYLIAENFKAFNEFDKAKKTWIYAIIATVAVFGGVFLIPDNVKVPNQIIPLIYTAIAYYLVQHFQAQNLFAANSPSQTQIDSYCTLADDNSGRSANGTLESFQSNVFVNNNVRWNGYTADQGYWVAIDSIVYESDTNIFDNGTITGTGGKTGNALAIVNNNPGLNGKIDVYTINFSVYGSGNSQKSFSIDPKLQANI